MAEIKSKNRLIHNIDEFRRTYIPKEIDEVEALNARRRRGFGADLTKKILSKIDLKK